MTDRYCFNQDESGHWYLIKWEDKEEFEELLYPEENDYGIAFEEKFSNNRLGMSITFYSFENVKELE